MRRGVGNVSVYQPSLAGEHSSLSFSVPHPPISLPHLPSVRLPIFLFSSPTTGQTLVDFRAYYMDQKTGTMKPTKTGMSLTVDAWHKVLENIDEINAAVAELEKK